MGNLFINVRSTYVDIKQNIEGAFLRRAKLVIANLTPVVTTPWQTSHAYVVGAQILDTNGNVQQCTTAGNSGTSAPSWNKAIGGGTPDGSVTWTNAGTNANSIPHGLPGRPLFTYLKPTSAGGFHQTAPPDATNVYITADGAGTSLEVYAEY
ncbi:MAG: hypothetical protein ACRD3T_06470 [Terriglobia bacterium]